MKTEFLYGIKTLGALTSLIICAEIFHNVITDIINKKRNIAQNTISVALADTALVVLSDSTVLYSSAVLLNDSVKENKAIKASTKRKNISKKIEAVPLATVTSVVLANEKVVKDTAVALDTIAKSKRKFIIGVRP